MVSGDHLHACDRPQFPAMSDITVGETLPTLRLPRIAGGELALESLRGRRVLLFFWGSW